MSYFKLGFGTFFVESMQTTQVDSDTEKQQLNSFLAMFVKKIGFLDAIQHKQENEFLGPKFDPFPKTVTIKSKTMQCAVDFNFMYQPIKSPVSESSITMNCKSKNTAYIVKSQGYASMCAFDVKTGDSYCKEYMTSSPDFNYKYFTPLHYPYVPNKKLGMDEINVLLGSTDQRTKLAYAPIPLTDQKFLLKTLTTTKTAVKKHLMSEITKAKQLTRDNQTTMDTMQKEIDWVDNESDALEKELSYFHEHPGEFMEKFQAFKERGKKFKAEYKTLPDKRKVWDKAYQDKYYSEKAENVLTDALFAIKKQKV